MAEDKRNQVDTSPQEICRFWFGELDADGRASLETEARWFNKDPQFDSRVRERFEPVFEAALDGALRAWGQEPMSALALILVLDQFSRNMFRGQAKMYSGDAIALQVAKEGLRAGFDAKMGFAERTFFRMPLMHSEVLADQEACVATFEALARTYRDAGQDALATAVEDTIKFAVAHRDIVAKWGRFPHRNAILGRTSTPEEVAFLGEPGSSF
ncbi:MAG: DUF924 domain-containing protein [Deltaproteobacteria bacterium]|nr:DUF924 domain-containing protein [Deltaproteobacteria bacterium]